MSAARFDVLDHVPPGAHRPERIDTFDALDRNARKFPWPYYAWLQASAQRRIYPLPDEPNFYVVHAYEDVRTVLMDPDLFSSQIFPDVEIPFFPMMKGAEHQRIRRVVQSLFTKRTLATLNERIETFSATYTSDLLERGRCDLVETWSSKIPLATIASIFGYTDLSHASLSQLRKQATALNIDAFPVGGPGPKQGTEHVPGALETVGYLKLLPTLLKLISTVGLRNIAEFNQYLKSGAAGEGLPRQRSAIAGGIERKHHVLRFLHTIGAILKNARPEDDTVVANFVRAHQAGEVSFMEVLMGCLIILLAGYGTTSSLLSVAAYLFSANPALLAWLKEDETRVDAFVEEMLRVYAPLQRTVRRVTAATRVGETLLPADAQLIVLLGAANMDSAAFDNPYQFDPARDAASHVAFGKGIHTCLGTFLARKVAHAGVLELISRLDRIEVGQPADLAYITDRDTGMYGFERLGVRAHAA